MRKILGPPKISGHFTPEQLSNAVKKAIKGRAMKKTKHRCELEDWEVGLINTVKEYEQKIIGIIDAQFSTGGCNDRWLSIARTDLQKGFMALIRSIAKPEGDEPQDNKPRTAKPIKWDTPESEELCLGAAVRKEGLLGEGEGNY